MTAENKAQKDRIDRARRRLLKAGAYVPPVILATALTVENVFASGNHGHGKR
ncbi:MAG: hypothetical protein M1118_06725 [Chloroflexi bacterium]|nr:hypothetical protein [Chloroflexota bacterium]